MAYNLSSVNNRDINITPAAVQAQRAPTGADSNFVIGQIWCNTSTGESWILAKFTAGAAVWNDITNNGGPGSFTTLDVHPGPTNISNNAADTGATNIGNTTAGGAVAIASSTSVGVDALTASHFTVTGAAADLTLSSVGGSVNISATEAAADAIVINATTGGVEISTTATAPNGDMVISTDGGGTLTIGSTGNTGTNDLLLNINGGTSSKMLITNQLSTDVASIEMLSPVGGIEITTQASLKNVVLDAQDGFVVAGASATCQGVDILNITPTVNRTTTINTNVVDTAVTDQIDIGTGGVSTDAGAQKIVNIGTGANLLGTQEVNISTGTATSGTKQVNIGNADALTHVNAIGVLNLNATNDGATSIGNTISGGAVLIESVNTITIESTDAVAGAIALNATAGGITVDSSSTVAVSVPASNITLSAVDVVITGSGSDANAIQLDASNAAGGITATVGTGEFNVHGGNIVMTTAGAGLTLTPAPATPASFLAGSGDPNGVVTAGHGSLYLNVTGNAVNNRAFINSDGATTWVAVTTAS